MDESLRILIKFYNLASFISTSPFSTGSTGHGKGVGG